VLQTLSILIQNIRSETAIFYLFSNNFINELITLRFDFEDDEVLGYFVNMLKAISLKLTQTTVQVRVQRLPDPVLTPAHRASPPCPPASAASATRRTALTATRTAVSCPPSSTPHSRGIVDPLHTGLHCCSDRTLRANPTMTHQPACAALRRAVLLPDRAGAAVLRAVHGGDQVHPPSGRHGALPPAVVSTHILYES